MVTLLCKDGSSRIQKDVTFFVVGAIEISKAFWLNCMYLFSSLSLSLSLSLTNHTATNNLIKKFHWNILQERAESKGERFKQSLVNDFGQNVDQSQHFVW